MNKTYASDVSIVLNVHRESIYVRRTIYSLSEAAAHATTCGIRTDLVVVFDRSDEATVNAVMASRFEGFSATRFIEVDHGSLGLARNSGIEVAQGEYVWLADADDLVSSNSISSMYAIADEHPRAVVFPEYLVAFGAAYWVSKYYDDSFVSTADFVYGHPYISRIFTRKDNFEGLLFHDIRLSNGFAYEDWHFNCELRARGMGFFVAPKTVFFYRQRNGSLLKQANTLSVGQIPHSTLFDPKIFAARVAQEETGSSRIEREARRQSTASINYRDELINDPDCWAMVVNAIKVDPGINLHMLRTTKYGGANIFPSHHWGHDYAQVCDLVTGKKFTDIVLLPYLGAGGGEKYILEIIDVLASQDPKYRGLVVTGEAIDHHTWINRLPQGTTFLDLFNSFPWLDNNDRDLLLLRLITAMGKGARLHLKTSFFSHRWFERFANVIATQTRPIYYRFCDERVVFNNQFIEIGSSFEFVSNDVLRISKIVSDHQRIVDEDRNSIGAFQEKWHCLYAPHDVFDGLCERVPSFRILWASRVSTQKLVGILPRIIRAVREVLPKVNFVVAGNVDNGLEAWVEKFRATPGLDYRGGYDGFESLEPHTFDALLYTSAFDGLPNVILEAMGHGLPVIAPDVGGIREAVQTGKTGWLLPQECDEDLLVRAYVEAVIALYRDWDLSRQMGRAAMDLVRTQHSAERHRQQVCEIFLQDEV